MRSVQLDCITRSSSVISVEGGAFIERRCCSTLARVCGAGSTCARMATIASAQATSAVASITKVCVPSANAPSDGSFAATRPIATGPRIAAATSPTSEAVVTRARCCESIGRSRKTAPKAKYTMPIHGRVTALPNTNHENSRLTSVAAIAARLNM